MGRVTPPGSSTVGTLRRAAIALLAVAIASVLPACSDDAAKQGEGHATTVGSGDHYRATIRRTTGGVPHITGDTLRDVAFGQGWASGEDRSCDLADQVLKVRGERARWFGAGANDANIKSDAAWLAIGIFDRASKDWEQIPAATRELVTAFTDGWNGYLKATGVTKLDGWCSGTAWVREVKPVEVYAYMRSIALSASGARLANYIATAHPPTEATPTATTSAARFGPVLDAPLASNGWAIGKDRSADHRGMLLANPHFPWEGELRFWEVHLTVPGKIDAYGAQLSGLPGIGIGFTRTFGWTHTVSAGNRFTAYRLDLVPGSPTKYRYGSEVRDLVPTEHKIEVLGSDGTVETVTRTTWASHYGPVIDFPGAGWTDTSTITYRDANIDNKAMVEQYFAFLQAKNLDEFIEAGERINGVPLFNTIATSDDGRAYYADWSATPNLSREAIEAYDESLKTDLIAKVAADAGAVLLNGSDPRFEWVDEPGARSPGLVPASRQPHMERSDYVFNANDSFWMSNATAMLSGDYSPLHGRQETARSPRTRENAIVLEDTSDTSLAGPGGRFTLASLAKASLANQGYTARELRSAVVERCSGVSTVEVPAVPDEKPSPTAAPGAPEPPPGLPAATVDIAPACKVLEAWDGVYDLSSRGAVLWREFLARFKGSDFTQAGALWATPFDPKRPVDTPSGLAPPTNGTDQILVNLGQAVQVLNKVGLALDAALGDVQFAMRGDTRVPIHGGTGIDGTTNIVMYNTPGSILDPALLNERRERLVAGSALSRLDDQSGYPVNYGTSFLLALAYTDSGPKAKAFLTYSDTQDRSAKDYLDATERFSRKEWRDVAFDEKDVAKQTRSTLRVRG